MEIGDHLLLSAKSCFSPFSIRESSAALLLAICTASIIIPRSPCFSSAWIAWTEVPAGEHTSSFNWWGERRRSDIHRSQSTNSYGFVLKAGEMVTHSSHCHAHHTTMWFDDWLWVDISEDKIVGATIPVMMLFQNSSHDDSQHFILGFGDLLARIEDGLSIPTSAGCFPFSSTILAAPCIYSKYTANSSST